MAITSLGCETVYGMCQTSVHYAQICKGVVSTIQNHSERKTTTGVILMSNDNYIKMDKCKIQSIRDSMLKSKSLDDKRIKEIRKEIEVLEKQMKIQQMISQLKNILRDNTLPCRCKGKCEMDLYGESQYVQGYKHGQKYCSACLRYMSTESFRCYCCNQTLRKSKRYNTKVTLAQSFL